MSKILISNREDWRLQAQVMAETGRNPATGRLLSDAERRAYARVSGLAHAGAVR